MPVSKRLSERAALADLHERIARVQGFRPSHVHPDEKPSYVARLLKILEERGRVLFVDGVGWVDSESVVRRYREYIGETRPTENLRKVYKSNQKLPPAPSVFPDGTAEDSKRIEEEEMEIGPNYLTARRRRNGPDWEDVPF